MHTHTTHSTPKLAPQASDTDSAMHAFSLTHTPAFHSLDIAICMHFLKKKTSLEVRGQLRRATRACRPTPTSFYVRIFIQKEPLARSEFTPALHLVIPDADGSPTAGSPQRDHLITKVKEIGEQKFRKEKHRDSLWHPLHTKEGDELPMFLVPCLQSSISTHSFSSFFAMQLALVFMITTTSTLSLSIFPCREQGFSIPAENSGAPAESSGYTLRCRGDLTCGHFRSRRGEAEKPKNQRSLRLVTGRSIT